jgi:hypothetical protein
MAQTNHTLLLNIMSRLSPPLPVTPVTPVAGDVVTYRSMGDVHTGTVDEIGEFFDEPACRIGKLWISCGQVVTSVESRVAA